MTHYERNHVQRHLINAQTKLDLFNYATLNNVATIAKSSILILSDFLNSSIKKECERKFFAVSANRPSM